MTMRGTEVRLLDETRGEPVISATAAWILCRAWTARCPVAARVLTSEGARAFTADAG